MAPAVRDASGTTRINSCTIEFVPQIRYGTARKSAAVCTHAILSSRGLQSHLLGARRAGVTIAARDCRSVLDRAVEVRTLVRLLWPGMTDDAKRAQRDHRLIELDDPDEIVYWLKYLDTSRDELMAAISAVGTSAQAVKDHLREKRDKGKG
jgi:hypothetical protein